MKLKTSLQLSAIIPVVFAIAVVLLLMWRFRSMAVSDLLDIPFMALLGLLGIIMTAVVVSYSKNILKKIKILDAWTDTILKGNLDYHAKMDLSDDEIGRLSEALSKLIREVKEASAALQRKVEEHKREADEHKRNAASSQTGMRHMVQALGRVKESQEEVIYKERQRLLEQVIRGVIHDMGEALTPVLGAGDLVCTHPEMLKDQVRALQQVKTMHAGVQRARKSLKNLAGVFRQPQHETQPVDLHHAVKRGLAFAEARRKEEGIADTAPIIIQTDLAMTAAVPGEDTDIEDAVAALILNAMEAMPGGGTMMVSTVIQGPSAILEVRDSGKGMSAEVRNRCLDPFYSTKKCAGAGMGLTMVASTVSRHRGSLKIESEEGNGTRIFVTLPLWKERVAEETLDLKNVRGGSLRILVVDDDEWARDAITAALKAIGHTAEAVADGQKGLARLKAEKFDVAFVDRAMPVMSGDRLAAAIKQTFNKMPIIMLTAFGHTMIAEDDIPGCVDVVLPKPVTMKDLEKAIAQARAKVGKEPADKENIAPDWDWTGTALK